MLRAVGDASLSPSVFYYYFASKEDLFKAAMDDYLSGYFENIVQILDDESPDLSLKVRGIVREVRTAVLRFSRIAAFFAQDAGYSRQLYSLSAEMLFSRLVDPTQRLLERSVAGRALPETELLRAIGPRRMARLLLYASYSLFHKEDEARYLADVQQNVGFLPTLLEQLLGLPSGSLGKSTPGDDPSAATEGAKA